MKCDQCSCAMRNDSTVCSNSSCSSRYICDICGSQRLTSEPLAVWRVSAARWPDTSDYIHGQHRSAVPRSSYVLDETAPTGYRAPDSRVGPITNQPDMIIELETGDPLSEYQVEIAGDIHIDYAYGAPGLNTHNAVSPIEELD